MSEQVTVTYEGKPLSVLNELVEKRKKILGETTKQAVTATAIAVVKSLRAGTKTAPKKPPETSYTIEDTGYVGGWERVGGKYHRVPRVSLSPRAPKVAGIFPVNLAGQKYEKGEVVKVYRITPASPNMKWEKTKHKKCWYVFARSEGVAKKFAIAHVARRIMSYLGLAKTTLGFAMAAISGNGTYAGEAKSKKSLLAASRAADVRRVEGADNYALVVKDLLDYSVSALKDGNSGISAAMKKAANSIAGRLRKVASQKLSSEQVSIPFPEVSGKK